ncbi:hypothetical protein AUJ65_04015 [Candidatus Micrarchaeota archaeon CG1_02_51_15]|nr:MAG: hypothetical protein AUJ65_04015 [Candidatus Micrarchaeota archaeon CG1_02_51_15]
MKLKAKRGMRAMIEWCKRPIHHYPERREWHLADGSLALEARIAKAALPDRHLLTADEQEVVEHNRALLASGKFGEAAINESAGENTDGLGESRVVVNLRLTRSGKIIKIGKPAE